MSSGLIDPLRSSSVTVAGQLNPLILQPDWLLVNGLIDADDRDASLEGKSQILTGDLVHFEYARFLLEADRTQLTVETVDRTETPAIVRDLVLGVLRVLVHTPVNSVVIEHGARVAIGPERRATLFNAVAAPDLWAAAVEAPSLGSLSIVSADGLTNLALQPSRDPFDVEFRLSRLFRLSGVGQYVAATAAASVLADGWDDAAANFDQALAIVVGGWAQDDGR